MLLQVFSIYDSGVKAWRSPMFVRFEGEILRQFRESCNKPDTDFAKHPNDYSLFRLGTWDDDKCLFNLVKVPELVISARECVNPSHVIKPVVTAIEDRV